MSWKNLLMVAAVAALFGFAGSEFSISKPVPEPARVATLRQTIDAIIRHRSDLTAAQKSAIVTLNDQYTMQHNHLMANLLLARAHLGDAFSENMTLSEPTKEAIETLDDAVGDIQTQTINYVVDVRKVLTPRQRHDFDDKVVEILMRGTP